MSGMTRNPTFAGQAGILIWGDRYPDAGTRLVQGALDGSRGCAGVVVLTDRTGRRIDPRARQVAIPAGFDLPEMKTGGYPVKLSMFDLDCLPSGATCIYLDLDSVITGDLGRLARLAPRAPIWMIPVFPKPFSMLHRALWRLSGRRIYARGNSSVFVYRNGFAGNPTAEFLRLDRAGALAPALRHDDRFVAWCCQDRIRGFSTSDVVNFRFEFLAPALWMADVLTAVRARARRDLVVVTFAGPRTKPEVLAGLPDGAIVTDHHGRVGRWTDRGTSGLRRKLLAWFDIGSAVR
jgi:hypothetical protein